MSAPSSGSAGSPGSDTASSGQGFGIALAEAQEIAGLGQRQDHQVALHIAGRHAGRMAAVASFAHQAARRAAVGGRRGQGFVVHRVSRSTGFRTSRSPGARRRARATRRADGRRRCRGRSARRPAPSASQPTVSSPSTMKTCSWKSWITGRSISAPGAQRASRVREPVRAAVSKVSASTSSSMRPAAEATGVQAVVGASGWIAKNSRCHVPVMNLCMRRSVDARPLRVKREISSVSDRIF